MGCDALTASISVVLAPWERHLSTDVLCKGSLVVVEVDIKLACVLAEEPNLFVIALVDLGLVVGDTDWCPVVVESRDRGVLHVGVARVARLYIVSYQHRNRVRFSLRSIVLCQIVWLCTYLVNTDASACLSTAGQEGASGEKLRSLHLAGIDVVGERVLVLW